MQSLSAAAPLNALLAHYGFEPDHVVAAARALLGRM